MVEAGWQRLCEADALRDGEAGVRFAVTIGGAAASGFAIRHTGKVRAYLNRCAHVAMELDWQPAQFFDDERRWLVCATHGALYEPSTGNCAGGPCAGRGGLRPITVAERDGAVYWLSDAYIAPAADG